MKQKIIDLLKLTFLLFMFFNIGLIIRKILMFTGIDVSLFNYSELTYFSCLVDSILVIIVIILYEKIFNKDWYLLKNKFDIREFLKYACIFFAVKIVSAIITAIIIVIIGSNIIESENQSIIVTLTSASPILMIISSSLLAPIVEEGVFRLGFRKLIKNNYLFIFISGFVFGLMHIFPTDLALSVALTQGITYIAIGSLLSWVYVKTDNIWIVILLHSLNNLISMLAII